MEYPEMGGAVLRTSLWSSISKSPRTMVFKVVLFACLFVCSQHLEIIFFFDLKFYFKGKISNFTVEVCQHRLHQMIKVNITHNETRQYHILPDIRH